VELITAFIDIVLHLDAHLLALTQQYGVWVYAILFLIIYCETGLVITPFLPEIRCCLWRVHCAGWARCN